MKQGRIERNLGTRRATAKEVDRTTFSHQVSSKFPGVRVANRLNHDVGPTSLGTHFYLRDERPRIAHQDALVRSQHHGAIDLLEPACHHYHTSTVDSLREPYKHQPDWPKTHNGKRVPRSEIALIKPSQNTRERLGQGSVTVVEVIGNNVRVFSNDAGRNAKIFGVCSVVKQQIFAKIRLAALTKETFLAGSRVGRNHSLSDTELCDTISDGYDVSCHLVPEESWRLNHLGVVTAKKDLYIGAARQPAWLCSTG
jgi:hypothetical protein